MTKLCIFNKIRSKIPTLNINLVVDLPKMNSKIWILTLAVSFLYAIFGCKSHKTPHVTMLNNIGIDSVIFGGGGGFTGVQEIFILHRNGILIKQKNRFYKEEKVSLDDSVVMSLFQEIKLHRLDTINFNHPYNMSYFLSIHQKGKVSNKAVWGDPKFKVPMALDRLYSHLQATTQKINK